MLNCPSKLKWILLFFVICCMFMFWQDININNINTNDGCCPCHEIDNLNNNNNVITSSIIICSELPPFNEYILNNNINIDLLLNSNKLMIERFGDIIEPYISCIPWSEGVIPKLNKKEITTTSSECKLYPEIFTGNLLLNGSEMFIIDLFAFGYEMDILEIRINTLYPIINHFILMEDIYAQRIIKKPLFYQRNKYKRFATLDPKNKIIHFIKDDDTSNYYNNNNRNNDRNNDWRNENYFRDKGFLKYIKNIYSNDIDIFLKKHPNSILLISDLDEIPDPEKLKLLKYCEMNKNIFNKFWNNSEGRIIETSYQFFQHNFNIFWFDRGIKSFMFYVNKKLYNKFINNQFNFNRNKIGYKSISSFNYLKKINYTGWHLSRIQTPYSLYLKHLYLAEGGSWDWLKAICQINIKNWTFKSLWNNHEIINIDWYKKIFLFNFKNISQSKCEKEIFLHPYWIKIFLDNGLEPYKVNRRFNKNGYQLKHTYKLPKYLLLNHNRYPYFFPKFCKLKNYNYNLYDYKCNFTNINHFYDNDKSCWMTINHSFSC